MKLSSYPKQRLSWLQVKDEEKLEQSRKELGITKKCPLCNGTKFFITTMGIEVCANPKCFCAVGMIL